MIAGGHTALGTAPPEPHTLPWVPRQMQNPPQSKPLPLPHLLPIWSPCVPRSPWNEPHLSPAQQCAGAHSPEPSQRVRQGPTSHVPGGPPKSGPLGAVSSPTQPYHLWPLPQELYPGVMSNSCRSRLKDDRFLNFTPLSLQWIDVSRGASCGGLDSSGDGRWERPPDIVSR